MFDDRLDKGNLQYRWDAVHPPCWECRICHSVYAESRQYSYEPVQWALDCCQMHVEQLSFVVYVTRHLKGLGFFKYGNQIGVNDQIDEINKQWSNQ